jgi:tetratricopeptide (TPR) repeat protein
MRILIAILGFFLAACSAPPASAPALEEPKKGEAKTVLLQAESPEMEKILRELMAGRSAEEQQQIALSQRHYALGLAYMNKGDFERAKIEAQEAVRIWTENIPARTLLSEVGDLLIGRPAGPRSIGEQAAREALVATEQAQIEIAMHLVHGKRYFDAKMYESALREFQSAEFKILHLPYELKALNDLLPQVRDGITRSKSSLKE